MDLIQRPAGDGQISVSHLSKRFGPIAAVDDLSFDVDPGRVTGFLGPNGAGKTTTLRMLLGLITPTSGSATIGGRRYVDIPRPSRVVGAALEASSFHPGRTARDHLRVMALPAGVSDRRVDELLELVGLDIAAGRRVGSFSLGMRQRLALAGTLLGDPSVLLLDEPANGLDPEGIAWLRGLLRTLAAEGRTVLISSHVLAEVQQTVDDVVIIARGKLVHSSDLEALAALAGRSVRARTPEPTRLAELLRGAGLTVSDVVPMPPGVDPRTALAHDVGRVEVVDVDSAVVARLAADAAVPIFELAVQELELEQVFLELVAQRA
ncbi:MAG TPA: ABC transporter ATP-binding protein [Actinopolymorphaceae bacterium]|jgi:ABC-2 type transport system ATP-binding protein